MKYVKERRISRRLENGTSSELRRIVWEVVYFTTNASSAANSNFRREQEMRLVFSREKMNLLETVLDIFNKV